MYTVFQDFSTLTEIKMSINTALLCAAQPERRKRAGDRSLSDSITLLILQIKLIPFTDNFYAKYL